MNATRIPLNLFGAPFGLAGLANAWYYAARHGQAPEAVADVLLAIAAVVWVIVLVVYARSAIRRRALGSDLTDPALGPFAALAVITPLVLAADGIVPHAFATGRVVVDVFVVLTFALGAWFTGQWIYGPFDYTKLHPGYFLPTAAGGFLAAAAAGAVHQERLAQAMLGSGLVCWVVLGSMIFARLQFAPPLPGPLTPTIAIEVAPPAVAMLGYFAFHGERIDGLAAGLGGYGLLMVLAQLRLLPAYRRLHFAPAFWAFTFSWAAVVTASLHWLVELQPTGWRVYGYLLLAAISVLVGAIAARTLLALARGELLPRPSPAPSAAP